VRTYIVAGWRNQHTAAWVVLASMPFPLDGRATRFEDMLRQKELSAAELFAPGIDEVCAQDLVEEAFKNRACVRSWSRNSARAGCGSAMRLPAECKSFPTASSGRCFGAATDTETCPASPGAGFGGE
jgi:hypothetical protein